MKHIIFFHCKRNEQKLLNNLSFADSEFTLGVPVACAPS